MAAKRLCILVALAALLLLAGADGLRTDARQPAPVPGLQSGEPTADAGSGSQQVPIPSPSPLHPREHEGWQKGFAFWSQTPAFGSRHSFAALRRLKAAGANTVSPVITWYLAHPYDVRLHPGRGTPADDELVAAVDEAHRLGLQVVLRFHVDCEDGSWRARINPDDKDALFTAYSAVLNHYADLAQAHGVEGMVIGAELSSLTGPAYTSYWRSMIAEVRRRFGGFLTYSAQWGSAPPSSEHDQYREFEQIEFWQELDYLGISAYFELAQDGQSAPSRQELLARWDEWRRLRIEPFQARYGMPLLFTEVGYPSSQEAARHPWNGSPYVQVNLQLQADLYSALFESWSEVPWFGGAYLWFWPTDLDAGVPVDSDYPPVGKPAEQVLRDWHQLLDDMERTTSLKPADAGGTIPPGEGR